MLWIRLLFCSKTDPIRHHDFRFFFYLNLQVIKKTLKVNLILLFWHGFEVKQLVDYFCLHKVLCIHRVSEKCAYIFTLTLWKNQHIYNVAKQRTALKPCKYAIYQTPSGILNRRFIDSVWQPNRPYSIFYLNTVYQHPKFSTSF